MVHLATTGCALLSVRSWTRPITIAHCSQHRERCWQWQHTVIVRQHPVPRVFLFCSLLAVIFDIWEDLTTQNVFDFWGAGVSWLCQRVQAKQWGNTQRTQVWHLKSKNISLSCYVLGHKVGVEISGGFSVAIHMVSYSGAGASCGTRRDEREVRTDRIYAKTIMFHFVSFFARNTTDSKKQWTGKPESISCFLCILLLTIKPGFSIFK